MDAARWFAVEYHEDACCPFPHFNSTQWWRAPCLEWFTKWFAAPNVPLRSHRIIRVPERRQWRLYNKTTSYRISWWIQCNNNFAEKTRKRSNYVSVYHIHEREICPTTNIHDPHWLCQQVSCRNQFLSCTYRARCRCENSVHCQCPEQLMHLLPRWHRQWVTLSWISQTRRAT